MTDRIVGTPELAAMLGSSAKALRALADEIECPAYHIGRDLRWPLPETLDWLRRRRPARHARNAPKGAKVVESASEARNAPKVVDPASEAPVGLSALEPSQAPPEPPNVASDPFVVPGPAVSRRAK